MAELTNHGFNGIAAIPTSQISDSGVIIDADFEPYNFVCFQTGYYNGPAPLYRIVIFPTTFLIAGYYINEPLYIFNERTVYACYNPNTKQLSVGKHNGTSFEASENYLNIYGLKM